MIKPASTNIVTHQAIKEIENSTTLGSNKFDLNGKLYIIAAFLGVMLLLLIAALSVKPLMEKRRRMTQGEEYTPMKLLGDLSITPKQKLSLVQIGSEQILISVSQDNINFIQKIGEPKKNELPESVRSAFKNSSILPPQSNQAVNSYKPKQISPKQKESRPATNSIDPVEKISTQHKASSNFDSILAEETKETTTPSSSRINFKIDDDGIENLTKKDTKNRRQLINQLKM